MPDKSDTHGRFERWFVPAAIILFCVAAFYVSTTFKKMPPILKRGIQPSDFPQLLLSTMVLLTIAMAWFDPVKVTERLKGTVWGPLVFFALFAALTGIDLFLALAVFAAGLTFYWGERRRWVLGTVGVLVPASIFFLFDEVFQIRFPRGLLTNLWYG